MERNLLWSAMAVGILGYFYCWLVANARQENAGGTRETFAPSLLALAIALPLFVFCVTLPETPPFGAGQGFGRGFLLGSIGALLAMLVIRRTTSTLAPLLAAQFAALVIIALPLLFMRATIIDTLLGVACGWLAVTLVLMQGLRTTESVVSSGSGAGFAVTLCAVSAIGIYRDFLTPEIVRGTWSALAVAFAAGVPVSVLFSEQLRLRVLRGQSLLKTVLISTFLSAAILLLLANLLAFKIIVQPGFSIVVALGLLAGIIMWWAAQGDDHDASENSRGTSPSTPLVPLGGFVMLAAIILSFGILQGFGVGLMLLAVWSVLGIALQTCEAGSTSEPVRTSKAVAVHLPTFALFGVILLLERLFEQRFRTDLRGVAITDYYALLGFLLGAGLPSLLAGWLRANNSPRTLWLRLLFIGFAVLAVPAVLMIVWGVKTSFALFFGLALACLLARNLTPPLSINAALISIAIAALMTQWTHRLLPLAEMTRAERLRALGVVIIALLVIVIVGELSARLARSRNASVEVAAS